MTPFLNPTFLIAILIALSVHEAAHGWVANKLGDPTAEAAGRVTLNPLAHLDPMGTLLFLFVGFGWGKPVPINPMYFRQPKRDTALVSLAGPVSNFLVAALSFALLTAFFPSVVGSANSLLSFSMSGSIAAAFFRSVLQSLLFIDLGLMAFNLLPIAPLDGSKVLQAFVPLRFEEGYERYMQYGPYILIGLLLAESFLGISLLSSWIYSIIDGALRMFSFFFLRS
ncbi:MAG: site-2 protease family protein [Candidatus Peribacteraceae bacterium]